MTTVVSRVRARQFLNVNPLRRVRKIAKIEYQLCHMCPSVRPSVRMK